MKLKKSNAKEAPKRKKAAPKKAKRNDGLLKASDYENIAKEYVEISAQVKQLNDRKKELSEIIKSGADRLGSKDSKGSSYLPTDSYMLGRIAKVSLKKNDEKGYAFFSKKKDSDGKPFTDCIQQVTKYVVDEEAIAKAVRDGRISLEEVRKNVYDESVSYQVSVKSLDDMDEGEMPEVQQGALKKGKK